MRSEIIGAFRIIDLLSKGVDTSEIIRIQEKGLILEENVAAALSALPMVTGVRRTARFSKSDIRGIDIFVNLDSQFSAVDAVIVQVKSSTAKMEEFKARLREEKRIRREDVDEWLVRHRWIVLNGQLLPGNIVNGFLFQLGRINDYAAASEQHIASGK